MSRSELPQGQPAAPPAVPVIHDAGIVAGDRLSDGLVKALQEITERPVTRAADADALDAARLIYVGARLPENLRDERLLWCHSVNAGVDGLLGDGRWPAGVLLTRTVGRMAERIAQYVLGWILAEAQNVPAFLGQHRTRTWQVLPTELVSGQCAVVFGVGQIGAVVCDLLRRCGIRTIGVASRDREVRGCDRVITADQAHEVLPQARWVISTLPLTPTTRGMFDREMFASMKGATFINVGRGATVEGTALASALADETVRGAVLDVLAEEPADPQSACWDLPRTVVTSHSSGITHDEDVASDFATCWEAVRNGQLPELTAFPTRGY
ncbi:MAG TPA: NAD(P)-dependent oxidoreductase [Amycolatopsis sp.]|nr:NAD(P)-dependent oxidoreductase [Amycolatopsis sp.]